MTQQINAIDRFLADNPEFEKLSAGLSQFNVFRALKIEKLEIRHSNVLAWLLDPDESHGLSDIVLRRVLSNILLLSDKTIPGISAAKVELIDFTDIEVLREWKNIDILVIDRANRIVLFFENKIHSGESKGQLAKYMQIVEHEFPGYTLIPVFLTLDGQDGSRDSYICYSHFLLSAVLDKIFEQRKSQLAEPVQVFLLHYLDTLRRLTMQDQDLMSLCKTIYRKHREAIDLIVEYGMTSVFSEASEEIVSKDGDYEILYSTPSHIWFIPQSWRTLIPENGVADGWTSLKRPISICCWIKYRNNTVQGHIELSKMDDPDLRLKCAEALRDAGFSLNKKAFDITATYSRFHGKRLPIKDETDYDEMRSTIQKILAKLKEGFPKTEIVLKQVFSK